MTVRSGAIAIVPALDEARFIAATVHAVAALDEVLSVIVVDDGSRDGTGERAADAGAYVIRRTRSDGKAAALTAGVSYADELGYGRSPVAFIDADVAGSASAVSALICPVLADETDLAIATPRGDDSPSRRIDRLARDGITKATGWTPKHPLSGHRCLSRAALDAALPFAPGFGVNVGMTIDVLRAGLRVSEVPVLLQHTPSGASPRHRLAHYADIRRALHRK